jgi:hypothetical protein
LQYLRELPRELRLLNTGGITKVKRDEDERISEYRRTFVQRAVFGGLVRAGPRSRTQKRILVAHGTTRALNEFVRPDTANSMLRTISNEAQADVMISGHAGISFHRTVENTTFVGVGSVGRAADSPAEAEYAIVDWGDPLQVDFGKVEYDASEHLRAAAKIGLPIPSMAY